MSRDQAETISKPLRALLETGSMAGLTDAELIERFTASRDSGAEAAFAAIVSRHGPMVLGTCRLLLGDLHFADDAFQAVFLVLARRSTSIRRPDLLGPGCMGLPPRSRASRERRLTAGAGARNPRSKWQVSN